MYQILCDIATFVGVIEYVQTKHCKKIMAQKIRFDHGNTISHIELLQKNN